MPSLMRHGPRQCEAGQSSSRMQGAVRGAYGEAQA